MRIKLVDLANKDKLIKQIQDASVIANKKMTEENLKNEKTIKDLKGQLDQETAKVRSTESQVRELKRQEERLKKLVDSLEARVRSLEKDLLMKNEIIKKMQEDIRKQESLSSSLGLKLSALEKKNQDLEKAIRAKDE